MALAVQQKAAWLKSMVMETPIDGPQSKTVKFAVIHKLLRDEFGEKVSHVEAARIIHEAFPLAAKKHSSGKVVYVGLDLCPPPSAAVANPANRSLIAELAIEKAKCQDLNRQVQQLEAELQSQLLAAQRRPLTEMYTTQMSQLLLRSQAILHGPDTPERFDSFRLESLVCEVETVVPDLYQLFHTVGCTRRNKDIESEGYALEEVKAIMSLCILVNAHSRRAKGLQLLMGIGLIARGTHKQTMKVLNHAGVSVSYDAAWNALRHLTAEARCLEVVRSGHWLWVYDNLNIHRVVRHERKDLHNTMENLTSRLAVQMENVPDNVDWEDDQQQGPRQNLKVDDILPSAEDGLVVYQRAVRYFMEFLVTHFKSLGHLKHFVPQEESPHPVVRSKVVPMRILFKDEKYTDQNVDILHKIADDAALTGSPQVVVGDQSTCRNIRGAKQLMEPEISPIKRLKWAHEVPGDFHFIWECLRVIYQLFWGSASMPGSISNLRERTNRVQVDKGAKTFSVSDEFLLHIFKSHLIAAICHHLKLQSPSDTIEHEHTASWLRCTAESIIAATVMPLADSVDPVYSLHRHFLRASFLYIDLRNAIRFQNGEHVVRLWKFWLVYFLSTDKKNYSCETINMICNLKANFPKAVAYIITHNRTVNMHGKPGYGKPIDQMMEHYNLIMKQVLRASGANATGKHVEDVSLSGLFMMQAAKKLDEEFQVHQSSTKHTVRDAGSDVAVMASHLMDENAIMETSGRTCNPFPDPLSKGMEKIAKGWIEGYLSRNEEPEPVDRGTVEFEYELYYNT